ncbi:DUF397 domain-containing protein [Saccharopolyspora spinosa]|uniref:Uncharacterized protein DUF397 n=1 Tax=Saccharopolyspora spinosa TaxID=60894 RepID=A0A2N3Y2N3_SACSN|nr:DUF397 domain-containing protein [Saccharopolyspora spinosa]PKW17184.1 uncharacterized protein DUF397 [Saccharopolyspora spinosa]
MPALDIRTVRWRKSSRSSAAANCVEVAFLDAAWCKSSLSGANANCVEVAFAGPAVGVRDSKDPDGAVLAFPVDRWSRFVESLR